MIEIALTLVIFALCGLLAFQDRESRKERKSLLNAILAKTTEEMANLELADKTKINVKSPNIQSDGLPNDMMPMSDTDDDTFMRAIRSNDGDTN